MCILLHYSIRTLGSTVNIKGIGIGVRDQTMSLANEIVAVDFERLARALVLTILRV